MQMLKWVNHVTAVNEEAVARPEGLRGPQAHAVELAKCAVLLFFRFPAVGREDLQIMRASFILTHGYSYVHSCSLSIEHFSDNYNNFYKYVVFSCKQRAASSLHKKHGMEDLRL